MRHTTRLTARLLFPLGLLSSLLGGCVAPVGGDTSGRDHQTDTSCKSPEKREENITIHSADDFDKLPTGCWDLYGSLTLQGSDITSLDQLGQLVGVNNLFVTNTKLTTLDAKEPLHVYGSVSITGNSKLTDLDNLEVEHAEDLAVQVTVEDNAVLDSVTGLSDLTRIEGDLTITGNPKLSSLSLRQLTAVDGTTRIADNAALTSVDLGKLQSVHRVELTNNTALTSFAGFAATGITGDVIVRGNRALTTLGTMGSLDRLEGNLTIDDNDALTSLGLFTTSMHYLTGQLSITNNGALADLGQLSRLQGIGSISINTNPNLSACVAQEVAQCVPQHGNVSISNNKTASNCTYWCN